VHSVCVCVPVWRMYARPSMSGVGFRDLQSIVRYADVCVCLCACPYI